MDESKILQGFGGGVCCSMAVFGELAPQLGLDAKTAKKIASAFGSGIGHASTCGCVVGALMALGYKYGNDDLEQLETRAVMMAKKTAFEQAFIARFGSLNCPQMLEELDPAVEADKNVIIERGLMAKTCAPAVCAACEIAKALL